jgi:hypothetical protein
MALWGKVDNAGSKPKYLSTADKAKCFFVDATEAKVASNRAKGITGPGWWLVNTAGGKTKVECLVPMLVTQVAAGDATDDATIADA